MSQTCANLVIIPGAQGPAGPAATNGNNGLDAVSYINGGTTLIPAYGASVTLPLLDPSGTRWMAMNEILFIGTPTNEYGYYQVTGIVDTSHVTVQNLGDGTNYPGNINGNGILTFADGTRVSPGGFQGPTGITPAGAFMVSQNLIEGDPATMQTNLGLGTAAQLASGDVFQVANNLSEGVAATKRTNLGLTIGTNVQAYSSFLAGFADAGPGAADRVAYLTGANTFALAFLTSFMRGLLASSTADAALATLRALPRYGLLGKAAAIDMNVATSDNAITLASSRYRIDKVTVENASVNLTTATAGLFTAAGGGGTTLAADQSLAALTATSKYKDLTLDAVTSTDLLTAGTVYLRVGTAQGVAATANVWIWGYMFD